VQDTFGNFGSSLLSSFQKKAAPISTTTKLLRSNLAEAQNETFDQPEYAYGQARGPIRRQLPHNFHVVPLIFLRLPEQLLLLMHFLWWLLHPENVLLATNEGSNQHDASIGGR